MAMWMVKNNMDENKLVILKHERFAVQFYYDSDTNIMGENLFKKFNLPQYAVMRRELAEKLYSLVPVLEHFYLKCCSRMSCAFMKFSNTCMNIGKKKPGRSRANHWQRLRTALMRVASPLTAF